MVTARKPDGRKKRLSREQAGMHQLAQQFAAGDKDARKDVMNYYKQKGELLPPPPKQQTGVVVVESALCHHGGVG